MSTIFSGTTTGTSGNTTIQVYTLSANTGSTRTATLSVNNGEETGTVSLSQYPKPVMSRSGSGTIPASGGTVSFSVNSAYPFFFRNTPSNVSDITAGGQSYISGNVPAGTYAFDATIGLNPSTASTSDVIEMAFQRFDGAYSYTRPDAASFRVPYQQEGSDEPVVSEINVPVYFDTDGQNVFICLGQSLPFEVRGSVEITYRKGNIELCPFVFSAGESQILLSDFRGTAIPLSDFDTSLSDYKSITSFLLSNGAPEMTTAYGSDTYYIYCSKVYSSYFIGELETLGNNLDGITWGTEPSVPIDYSKEYFTLKALESGEFAWRQGYMMYSLNDGAWTTWSTGSTATLSVSAGDEVRFKSAKSVAGALTLVNIRATGNFDVYGNILSLFYDNFEGKSLLYNQIAHILFRNNTKLINAKNLILPQSDTPSNCYEFMFEGCTSLISAPALPSTTLGENCYEKMFAGCTSLTVAPDISATTLAKNCCKSMFSGCTSLTTAPALPATTLADSCYLRMFAGCTSLTSAPAILPATTLNNACYYQMFSGCTSLTTAPVLPAHTLQRSCYYYMFDGCSSLTTAPALPATTLAEGCYCGMFRGCTSLNYIKCLATDISAENCTSSWVRNVASAGTFVKDANMSSWTTGTSGIPSGWTVETTREP